MAVIACLLVAPPSGSARPLFLPQEERLEVALTRAELQLLAGRANGDFWATWQKTDRAIVRLFHKDPAFASAVQFADPQVAVDSWPLLLEGLLDNVRWLTALGRHGDAQRMRTQAQRLVDFGEADHEIWATLVLNTLSRFLLAGWRDVDDPLATLEFQVSQALLNANQLRGRVRGNAQAPRTTLWQAVAVTLLKHPLPPWTVHRIAAQLVPVNPIPAFFGEPVAWHPAGKPGHHDPQLDNLTYALNLPFGLAPPGTPVSRHLAGLDAGLPAGQALLLGGGDGAEALAVAATGRFSPVVVMEHSSLAVRRNQQLAHRLHRWLAQRSQASEIGATLGDVTTLSLAPDSTSLVLAIHLLEYLSGTARKALYKTLSQGLLPGGQVVLSVHLAQGPRFEGLTTGFGNVLSQETPDGVQVILTQMVPASPHAVQVQQFFRETALRGELEGAFPRPQFDTVATTEKTPAGFVEVTVVLTKK